VTTAWSVTDIPVAEATAQDLLLRYMIDVSTSYQGRPPTDAELDTVLAQHHNDDLVPPAGFFLVARHDGEPAGCVGVRFGPAGFAELKRMFVAPGARGLGGGQVLLAAAEQRACTYGVRTMRLAPGWTCWPPATCTPSTATVRCRRFAPTTRTRNAGTPNRSANPASSATAGTSCHSRRRRSSRVIRTDPVSRAARTKTPAHPTIPD
jgi:GNAT superfamily N-acetyltransferase